MNDNDLIGPPKPEQVGPPEPEQVGPPKPASYIPPEYKEALEQYPNVSARVNALKPEIDTAQTEYERALDDYNKTAQETVPPDLPWYGKITRFIYAGATSPLEDPYYKKAKQAEVLLPEKQQQVEQAYKNLQYSVWKRDVYLQAMTAINIGITPEELYQNFKAPIGNDSENLAYVQDVFKFISQQEPAFTTPEQTQQALAVLSQEPHAQPVAMASMTVDEIVKSLSTIAKPEMPPGMTSQQLLDAFGVSTKDELKDEYMRMLLEASQEQLATQLQFPEIHTPTIGEWTKALLLQTGLVVADAMETYSRWVSKPIAGAILTTVWPNRAMTDEFNQGYEDARRSGENVWLAMGRGFDAWKANWVTKLAVETICDPLTYVGFGFVSKALRPIPFVGKFLAGANDAIMDLSDRATMKFLEVWRSLPKSTSVLAETAAIQAKKEVITLAQAAHGGTFFGKLGAEAVSDSVNSAIDTFVRLGAKAEDSRIGTVAKYLLSRPYIEEVDISDLLKALHIDDISDETLVTINHLFEHMGKADLIVPGRLSTMETTQMVLEALGKSDATDEEFNLVSKWLTRLDTEAIEQAKSFFKPDVSVYESLNKLYKHVKNVVKAQRASSVYRRDWQHGLMNSLFMRLEAIPHISGLVTFDRMVVIPAARLYLFFAMYPIQNTVEVFYRGLLREVNMFPTLRLVPPFNLIPGVKREMGTVTRLFSVMFGDVPTAPWEALSARLEMDVVKLGESPKAWIENLPLVTKDIPGRIKDVRIGELLPPALRSMKSFINYWAGIQAEMRNWYLLRRAVDEMIKLNPDLCKQILNSVPDIAHEPLEGLTKSEVQEMQEIIRHVSFRGPEAILKQVQDGHSMAVGRAAARFRQVLSQCAAIPPELRRVMDIHLETALKDPDKFIGDIVSATSEMAIARRLYSVNFIKELVDELKQIPINKESDLMAVLQTLSNVNSAVPDIIHEIRAIATKHALDMEAAEKVKFHDIVSKKLSSYMYEVSELTKQMCEIIGKSDVKISEKRQAALTRLISSWQKQQRILFEAREAESKLFRERLPLKPRSGKANIKWWDEINIERDRIWENYRKSFYAVRNEQTAAVMALTRTGGVSYIPKVDKVLLPHIAYLFGSNVDDIVKSIYRQETMSLISKDEFIQLVKSRVDILGQKFGKVADDYGFTDEAVGECYDRIMRVMGFNPEDVDILTPQMAQLENIRIALHELRQTFELPPQTVDRINSWLKEIAENLDGINFQEVYDLKVKAMENARKLYSIDFTDYTDENAIDGFIKFFFPFWTYEFQRWPWLARNVLMRPGVGMLLSRVQQGTDYGYIRIPGTDYQIAPFRGTVFMNLFSRLTKRDYPEYYDAFPGSNVIDYLSKFGFFPGIHIMGPMVLFGTKLRRPVEWGELMPPFIQTPLMATVAMFPDSEVAHQICDLILPNRFREYLIAEELANMGFPGAKIIAKKRDNITLTSQEQEAYDTALRHIATYEAMEYQVALLRFNPREKEKFWELRAKMVQELTGLTPEQQKYIQLHTGITGKDLAFYLKDLTPLQQQLLIELDEADRWSRLTYPLLPVAEQEKAYRVMSFWDEVQTHSDLIRENINDINKQLKNNFLGNPDSINIKVWREQLVRLRSDLASFVDHLHSTDLYKEIPVTYEERMAEFAKDGSRQPTFGPLKELLWRYYSLKPEETIDPLTGERGLDWDTYFEQVDLIIESMSDELKQEFIGYIQRNWTDVEKLWWTVNREYIRKYRNIYDTLLTEQPIEHQLIIKEYYSTSDKDKREELAEYTDPATGRKIVSEFRDRLNTMRTNMRYLNPMLDAQLCLWGFTQNTLTPEADLLYKQYKQQLIDML